MRFFKKVRAALTFLTYCEAVYPFIHALNAKLDRLASVNSNGAPLTADEIVLLDELFDRLSHAVEFLRSIAHRRKR